MGLYRLDSAFTLADWYQNVGAYDLNVGTDSLLDITRYILESDAYTFQGVVWPKGQDIFIDPAQTFSGSLNLVPNSYLVSLTGWSATDNQYTLRIYDKGAQSDLYYGQFAWSPTVVSNMTGTFNNGELLLMRDRDRPFGPYFFQSPLIILPPGTLQIQLTNIGGQPQQQPSFGRLGIVQLLFGIAMPKNTTTLNNRRVLFPQDPTGVNSQQTNAQNNILQMISTLVSGGG
jgi:hypothetical protein